MANAEHVAKLKGGTASWNEWRQSNQNERVDLSGADLRQLKHAPAPSAAGRSGPILLSYDYLGHVQVAASRTPVARRLLEPTTWKCEGNDPREAGVNLKAANLFQANLNGMNLQGADLREADLREADLREADLHGADLTYSILDGADLRAAHLNKVVLTRALLNGSDLTSAHLNWARLHSTTLRGTTLEDANLFGAEFVHADLTKASLRKSFMKKPTSQSLISAVRTSAGQTSKELCLFVAISMVGTLLTARYTACL